LSSLFGDDPLPPACAAERHPALRGRIDSATARLRRLPREEQRRLYEASRTNGPLLFALMSRLAADPLVHQLLRGAVERTRRAPSGAELDRAVTRLYKSAFRGGQNAFRPAAAGVLARLDEEFGADNARRVTLGALQGRYLALAARAGTPGFDPAPLVMAVASTAELRAHAIAQPAADAPGMEGAAAGAATTAAPAAARAASACAYSVATGFADDSAPAEEQVLATGIMAACFHIEAGVRNFSEFAEAMARDLGETVRPYLRGFYEAIRHYPGIDLSVPDAPG
jgi:hypothetical protein